MLGTGEVGGDIHTDISAPRGVAVEHSRRCIDKASTLLEDAVGQPTIRPGSRAATTHDFALHLVRGPSGIGLQRQGHHARDDGRRLRRAGHIEVPSLHDLRGEPRGEETGRRRKAHQLGAGRDDVRLHEAFTSRAGGRKRRQKVVRGNGGRAIVGHRASRNDIGRIARDADGHGGRSGIAGRSHNDNARLPGSHHGQVKRVVPVS